jgi:hypothetical protein
MAQCLIKQARGNLYFSSVLLCVILDTSVDTATGHGLDDRSSIPGWSKIFLFTVASRMVLGHIYPPIQLVPNSLSTWMKFVGREANNSAPSNTEIENSGNVPPLLKTSLWRGS